MGQTSFTYREGELADFLAGSIRNMEVITPDPDGLDDAALRMTTDDTIFVLQVYPDGMCLDCICSVVYELQSTGNPPLNFSIDLVPISIFNEVTSIYDSGTVHSTLYGTEYRRCIADYDILFFGSGDVYGHNDLSRSSAAVTRSFARLGRGVVFTHGTIAEGAGVSPYYHENFASLTDVSGLTTTPNWTYPHYTDVTLVSEDVTNPVLHYPFELPHEFEVNTTHSRGQVVVSGTMWYKKTGLLFPGMEGLYMHTYHNPDYNSYSGYFNYGHTSWEPPAEWEAKAMMNVMYFSYHGGRGTAVFVSDTFGFPCETVVDSILWSADVPGTSELRVYLKASPDGVGWTEWVPITHPHPIPGVVRTARCWQYMVQMTRGGAEDLPVFHWIDFYLANDGVSAELVIPETGAVSSCPCQPVRFRVHSLSDIVLDDATVEINGRLYTGGEYFSLGPEEDMISFIPGDMDCFDDGDTVSGNLVSVDNLSGCGLVEPVEFSFIVDLSPPEVISVYPSSDTIISNRQPNITSEIVDEIAGIDPYSITLSIGDSLFTVATPALFWDGHFLSFRTLLMGLVLPDTVDICLSVADSALYCSPNSTEFCWRFFVDTEGPLVELVQPEDEGYISCDSTEVIFRFYDISGTDFVGTIVQFGEESFAYPDGMEPFGDTLLIFPLTSSFSDGDSVYISVSGFSDIVGNLGASRGWWLRFDLSPPEIISLIPTPGSVSSRTYQPIGVVATDILSGIDVDSVLFVVDGDEFTGCFVIGDTLYFYPDSFGVAFHDGDTVSVCVSVPDRGGICPPNVADTCWSFLVNQEGPSVELITPPDRSIISCQNIPIELLITDENGVIPESIGVVFNEDTFCFPSPELSFSDTVLTVDYPEDFSDTNRLFVVSAYDSIGNPLGDIIRFEFYMDTLPPVIEDISPSVGSVIASLPQMTLVLTDDLAGVDSTSIRFSCGDTTLCFGDEFVFYSAGTLCVFADSIGFALPEDSLGMCIHLTDLATLCGGNVTDSCWYLFVDKYGPLPVAIRPDFSAFSSCERQEIVIFFDDPSGVREETIEFLVNGVPEDDFLLSGDTLFFNPDSSFADGETVCVEVRYAEDTLGNPMDSTFSFYFVIDLSPPVVLPVYPLDGAFLLEPRPNVVFTALDSISGLDTTSVALRVMGTDYYISSPAMYQTGDTFVFVPDSVGVVYPELTPVVVSVVSASDRAEYCGANGIVEPISWSFTIADDDTLPPLLLDYSPRFFPSDSAFYFSCILKDESGVYFPDFISDMHYPRIVWDTDGELEITANEGILALDSVSGDRIYATSVLPLAGQPAHTLIIFRLLAWDNDFDGERETDRSFLMSDTFAIDILPRPTFYILEPYPGSSSSCTDQPITLAVVSENGLDPESVVLDVDGEVFDITSPYLTVSGTLVVFQPPLGFFDEGEVRVSLVSARDTLGFPLSETIFWSFVVDTTPPDIEIRYPSDGALVDRDNLHITASFSDLSGVDTASFSLIYTIINGGTTDTLYSSSPGVFFNPDDILFDIFPYAGGFRARDGDSVAIEIRICDSPDYCEPNCSSSNLFFWIEPELSCEISTNPFTPNGDGYNDEVRFTYPKLFSRDATIEIYDLSGHIIRRIQVPAGEVKRAIWDGMTESGRVARNGIYIYIIKRGKHNICSGSVNLVR